MRRRTLLKTLKKNLFTIPFLLVFSFFDINLGSGVENAFFTVSGIIFSICISQIMSFDLSGIKNSNKYEQFSKSLKNIQESFFTEFAIAAIAFLVLAVFEAKGIYCSLKFWKFTFSLNSELHLLLIFSIIFFLLNYFDLYKNKIQIEEKIREETTPN